jgi:hypothetical protein
MLGGVEASEPRSLPELVAARARGGLASEEFTHGLTFADLGDPAKVPSWLAFLVKPGPWEIRCGRHIALYEPLTLLIGARAVARAIGLHEQDRVLVRNPSSVRGRLAGVAAALYAGAVVLTDDDGKPSVTVSDDAISAAGEPVRTFVGWCETCWLGALSAVPGELGTLLERMEARVADGELLVRGPLVMAGYGEDPAGTATAFSGGWLRTGQRAWMAGDGRIMLS